MSLLDILTGGKSDEASSDEQQAIQALAAVQTPTSTQLTLPELQQYAVSQNMTPAQTQAFLQQYNALANENVGQEGTAVQQAALAQLGQVANAGAAGTPVEQAQIAQALQQSNQNLAGQRGAIDQAAQARGVAPGLLQAALAQQNAGQDAQNANQAALQAQSQAYQTALNAMTGQAGVGQALQGQQNTQANTVAAAQNAMQQFNAANQQQAASQNAGYQQQANQYNTGMANTVGQQNTGLANQRTLYNAQVPETVFQNQMQKAGGLAGQYNNAAGVATGQGQQNAGLLGGIIGAGATAFGGPAGAMAGSQVGQGFGGGPPAGVDTQKYAPQGPGNSLNYACGGPVDYKSGGPVPGQAKHPGNDPRNDTVHAKLSPGEFVVPNSITQNHPEDVAALLAAMRHLRGQNAPASR
jgi:hypothetical protein